MYDIVSFDISHTCNTIAMIKIANTPLTCQGSHLVVFPLVSLLASHPQAPTDVLSLAVDELTLSKV